MKRLGLVAACALLGACSLQPAGDGPPRRDQPVPNVVRVPQPEPRSASGNPRFYDVYGQRYYVMNSAEGYRERGVASWYGKKFHGRLTSSGEVYDMHAVSAAHKTLPLPSWVRVTNLSNGRSVVLRVNDRGPFVDNRLIDLSYAAARELDLIASGTGLVEVETIDFSRSHGVQAGADATATPATLYMQIGAFSEPANAERLRQRVREQLASPVFVAIGESDRRTVHRVQIGPIGDVAEYDRLVAELAAIGVRDVRLIDVEATAGN